MTTTPNPSLDPLDYYTALCGCGLERRDDVLSGIGIKWCPLHAAAQQMLDALTSIVDGLDCGAYEPTCKWCLARAAINAAREGVTTG